MLAREGLVMNHKQLLRLYREENLRVRRRRGRKRAMGKRVVILADPQARAILRARRTGRRCATRAGVVVMATCGGGYGRSRLSAVGWCTVGWASCWLARVWS